MQFDSAMHSIFRARDAVLPFLSDAFADLRAKLAAARLDFKLPLKDHPDVAYIYFAAILFVALIVELVVRGERAQEDTAKVVSERVDSVAEHMEIDREIDVLRNEIDGIEDELMEDVEETVELVEASVGTVASLAEFDPDEIPLLPSSDRPQLVDRSLADHSVDDDSELAQAIQSFSLEAQELNQQIQSLNHSMAQDALKVNELSRLALSSNGSAVTLTDEVSAHAEHSPAPATPEKQLLEKPSWIRSLTGTRLRSLSVDNHNPWTSNAQTSFTLSDLAPQPLEISLPPESNPFASPMKEDAPRASPARARARSEVPSVETSPLKTPRMGLSPLRATGLRMSPSPLKSSPLAMLAKTWSEKVRERDDGL